jgi:hypothetical protein
MNTLIITGFAATALTGLLGGRIPTTWEWYYWPAALAALVAIYALVDAVRSTR